MHVGYLTSRLERFEALVHHDWQRADDWFYAVK